MILKRTADAASELIPLVDAKAHLKVENDDEDDYIDSLVLAARGLIEEATSRATITQTWVLKLDEFPEGDEIRLPRPPLLSVTSVQYVDGDGATQTWAASNYVVDTYSEPGRIRLAYDKSWPGTRAQPEAVTITYVAGYGAYASAVPQPLIHAAKLIVGDLHENREGSITGTIHTENPAVAALIGPYVFRYW